MFSNSLYERFGLISLAIIHSTVINLFIQKVQVIIFVSLFKYFQTYKLRLDFNPYLIYLLHFKHLLARLKYGLEHEEVYKNQVFLK